MIVWDRKVTKTMQKYKNIGKQTSNFANFM